MNELRGPVALVIGRKAQLPISLVFYRCRALIDVDDNLDFGKCWMKAFFWGRFLFVCSQKGSKIMGSIW